MSAPHGKKAVIEFYGNPALPSGNLNPNWSEANIVSMELPYPMYYSWDMKTPITHVKVHRKVASSLKSILRQVYNHARVEVKRQYGFTGRTKEFYDTKTLEYLHERRLDITGGTFTFKAKQGTKAKLSVHSFGAAIDIDPVHNPWKGKNTLPQWFIDCFVAAGWTWGGKWSTSDPMHFQYATGY